MSARYVVVGGGLAGAKAAETLREVDGSAEIVVVGEEAHRPYERPSLSKSVLRGDDPDDSVFVHEGDYYTAHGIELLTGVTATELDSAGRAVVLSDGRRLPYDRALLATGATPRRLPLPGAELPGVHYLRTLDDARALRSRLQSARSVAVVGAGWIGCEVAAAARAAGADVTMVDPLDVPLERVLGPEIGTLFRELHADNGVRLELGVGVTALRGDAQVESLTLADGRVVEADAVVVGIGVVPRVELAAAAGLGVADGILTDDRLRTTDPRVFAAGDVAAPFTTRYAKHLRVEHWATALNHGPAAARNMAGADEAYERLPYFYSDQYDLGLEYLGHAEGRDRVVVRGDLGKRELVAFYVDDGRVTAALAVNTWDVVEPLRRVIESGVRLADAVLVDRDRPLDDLVPA